MSEGIKYMKVRVLLYKAKFGDKSIVDNLISLWTWSKYAHVEIWTPDSDGEFHKNWTGDIDEAVLGVSVWGTCWTSTMRGKDNGTVKRDASKVLKHPDRWDYVEIEIDDGQYQSLLTWMNYQVKNNTGYSKWDLFKFVFPFHINDKQKNICSEFANDGLCGVGVLEKFGIVSPGRLHKKLIAKGYEVKQL